MAFALSGLGLANAQWSSDPAENLQLMDKSYWSTEVSMLPDGSFYILGVSPIGDIHNVTPSLFYFDKDGRKVWEDPMVFEIDSTMSWIKTNTQLATDQDGNAIVVAQDLCGNQIEKYTAWKVSKTGEYIWPEEGVNLHGEAGKPDAEINAAIKMLPQSDGSCLFAWMGDEIMMQRVSRDGQVQWGEGKAFGSGAYPYAFDAGDGDLLMIYQSSGIMARRLDFEGNDVWPEPVPVFSGELNSNIPLWTYIKVIPMSDGILVGYYAFEGDFHYPAISYIKFDGTHGFAEADQGLRLGFSDYFGFAPALDVDEENNAIYAAWEEYPGSQSISRMVCQKVSLDGELLWDPEGVELMPMLERPVSYQTVSVGPKGSVMIGVMEQYDGDGHGIGAHSPVNIHAFLLNANGEFAWADTSKMICNVPSVKYDLTCLPYSDDQWIFMWEDCRQDGGVDGGFIYGQNIGLDGTLGDIVANESRTVARPSAFSVWPNPARETLSLRLDNAHVSRPVQVELLNTNGAVIAQIYDGNLQAGSNLIEWNRPASVPAGFYILKAVIGNECRYAKVILQ